MTSKLLIIIPGLSFGGAERVTSFLSNYFIASGKDVYIISLSKGNHAYVLSPEIRIIELDASNSTGKLGKYRYLITELRKNIKEIGPSSILAMISYAGALAAVSRIGFRIPLLISERNDPNTSTTFNPFKKKVFSFIYHHLVTKAIFQTESARSYYFSCQNPKGVIIPNPLYLEDMPLPNTVVLQNHKIITAGRLSRQKNHRLLIEAFNIVHAHQPDYTLTIYGEGEERTVLEKMITELFLSDVVFLPGNENKMFVRLQEAEIFVMSSDYEGMPNALIEALAMGLPCITTDYSGGRGTVIQNEKNGLVVERRNVEALANAMLLVIKDKKFAASLGEEAKNIRNELDSSKICKLWLGVIDDTEKEYYENCKQA